MLRWSRQTGLQAAAFWENSKEQDGTWQCYQERISGSWSSKNGSERPAITVGMD